MSLLKEYNSKETLSLLNFLPESIFKKVPVEFYLKALEQDLDNTNYTALDNFLFKIHNIDLRKIPNIYLQMFSDNVIIVIGIKIPQDLKKNYFSRDFTLQEKLQIPLEIYCNALKIADIKNDFTIFRYIPEEILNNINIDHFIEKIRNLPIDERLGKGSFSYEFPRLIKIRLPINYHIELLERSIDYIRDVPIEFFENIPLKYLRKAVKERVLDEYDIPEHLRRKLPLSVF